MTDSTKSTWVQTRDSLLSNIHDLLHSFSGFFADVMGTTVNDLKTVGEGGLSDAKAIIVKAVTIAEETGGTWYQKRDAALAVILPELTALGIKLLSTSIDVLISDSVAQLGFAKSAAASNVA